MQNILFNGSTEPISAEIQKISEHTIKIITEQAPNTSGFNLITDSQEIYGNYEDYITVFQELEDGYVLSNDGSIYTEPLPPFSNPEPEPYTPTLEDIKKEQQKNINDDYTKSYLIGTDVILCDGSNIHIPNIDNELLISIGTAYNSAVILLESGSKNTMIPFDISGICNSYTPLDIINIYISIQKLVIYNRSLKNELFATIERCQIANDVQDIAYSIESLDSISLSSFKKSIYDGENVINEILSKYISIEKNV